MATIKFIQLSQSKYDELVGSRLTSNIYFTTDTKRLYKGDDLYSNEVAFLDQTPQNASQLDDNKIYIVASTGDMYVKFGNDVKRVGGKSDETQEIFGAISEFSNSISSLSSSKLDSSAFQSYSSTTSETLSSLSNLIDQVGSNSSVTMSSAQGTDNVLKVYTLTQGSREIGKINIPKDLVVTSGSVVKGTWQTVNNVDTFTQDANSTGIDRALKLTIANQADPVYINTLSLVKDHTGSTVDGITVDISGNNVISVSIADGTIQSSTLASDVQNSLSLADNSLQKNGTYYEDILTSSGFSGTSSSLSVDMLAIKNAIDANATAASNVNLASGSSNGTVAFTDSEGTTKQVSVTGLGSAAFTDANAYDSSGSANAVKSELLGESTDVSSALTLNGLSNAIAQVVGESTDAAGTLTINGLANSITLLNGGAGTSGSVANLIQEALSWQVVEDSSSSTSSNSSQQ